MLVRVVITPAPPSEVLLRVWLCLGTVVAQESGVRPKPAALEQQSNCLEAHSLESLLLSPHLFCDLQGSFRPLPAL